MFSPSKSMGQQRCMGSALPHDHNSIDETRSTILMGPQQQENLSLNDDAKSRQQLLSSSGNINTIMQRESQDLPTHSGCTGGLVFVSASNIKGC